MAKEKHYAAGLQGWQQLSVRLKQKQRAAMANVYSYSVCVLHYYSAEYECTIRPTIRTE